LELHNGRNLLEKKFIPINIMLILGSLLLISCGIPQEEYDSLVSERDSLQAEVTSLESKINSLLSDLKIAQDKLTKVEDNQIVLNDELETVQEPTSEPVPEPTPVDNSLSMWEFEDLIEEFDEGPNYEDVGFMSTEPKGPYETQEEYEQRINEANTYNDKLRADVKIEFNSRFEETHNGSTIIVENSGVRYSPDNEVAILGKVKVPTFFGSPFKWAPNTTLDTSARGNNIYFPPVPISLEEAKRLDIVSNTTNEIELVFDFDTENLIIILVSVEWRVASTLLARWDVGPYGWPKSVYDYEDAWY